jgi:hypothetical protein
MRGWIALSLIALLGVIVIMTFLAVFLNHLSAGFKEILGMLLGPMTALVASVAGYYFGSGDTPK